MKSSDPSIPSIPYEEFYDLFTPDIYQWTLGKDLEVVAKREIGEGEERRDLALDQMRNWILTTDFIKNCRLDSNFILRFLRASKFNIPRAQETLVKYMTLRQQKPSSFQNLSPSSDPMLMDLVNRGVAFTLPGRDKSGYRVLFSIGGNINSNYHTADSVLKAIVLALECLLEDEESQIRGFRYILDEGGLGISHLYLFNPREISHVLTATEKAMPIRHKRVDFLNLPRLIGFAFDFVKSLLSPKLKSRINMLKNAKDLHESEIDRDMLPEEYGGKIPLAQIIETYKSELVEKEKRFLALDQMEIDTTLMTATLTSPPAPIIEAPPPKVSLWKKHFGFNQSPCKNTTTPNGIYKKIEVD